MPVWPPTLPQCLMVDGSAEGFADNVLRSSSDTGPDKTRRRATSAPRPLQGSMKMTRSQAETLITFFRTTLADGAASFEFPPQILGTPGTPLLVRFSEPPTISLAGAMRIVSLRLEILP
jgi:hypothetical protein